jgi:hypothetical protein
MSAVQSTFPRALSTTLTELFDGPPADLAFMLNPGDPGLLRQLESIDAAAASTRPMPGETTIASHVDHVLYGFELLNRWIDGEENPWATADWSASWKRTRVDEAAWRSLVARLRAATTHWRNSVATRAEWDDVAAAGAIASVAHTAYHLGAIRQILAAQTK